MARILIVEDDAAMATGLKDGLAFEGHTVQLAGDGEEAIRIARESVFDLMILDVMLPKLNGLDVCRQLRQAGNQLPIIFLTARSQEIDKVLGLKLGADDYITKPFSFMELLARAEAVLRRSAGASASTGVCRFGDVVVDFGKLVAHRNGKPIELTQREFRLLQYFSDHRGEVIQRDTLLDEVWDYEEAPLTRTVDMHIAKLRKKIEVDPSNPRIILTVHGMGYKFPREE